MASSYQLLQMMLRRDVPDSIRDALLTEIRSPNSALSRRSQELEQWAKGAFPRFQRPLCWAGYAVMGAQDEINDENVVDNHRSKITNKKRILSAQSRALVSQLVADYRALLRGRANAATLERLIRARWPMPVLLIERFVRSNKSSAQSGAWKRAHP